MTCSCEHGCAPNPNPRQAHLCVRSGKPMSAPPPWLLSAEYAQGFYQAVGMNGQTGHALERLEMGARQYGRFAYLDRDNAAGGIEEVIDGVHYALFGSLQLFRDEQQGLDAESAEEARQAYVRAGQHLAAAAREFETARRVVRD